MSLIRFASVRRHAGALAVAVATLAALVAAGVWQHGRALRAAEAAAWDIDTAMKLAGTQVPAETDSFYFFVLEHAQDEPAELADKLATAAAERDFIGITGADSEWNRAALLEALALKRDQPLAGLVIIYLGRPEDEAALSAAARDRGADFRFVKYVPGREESI